MSNKNNSNINRKNSDRRVVQPGYNIDMEPRKSNNSTSNRKSRPQPSLNNTNKKSVNKTKVRKTNKKVKKTLVKKNIDQRIKVVSTNISSTKIPWFIYFVAVYTFTIVFVMLTFFSAIEKLNTQVLRGQDEKQILMEEKRYLEIMLNESYNITNIRKIAENELNMKRPEEHQIIYIDVPKETSINYNSQEQDTTNKFFDFIRNIF